MRDAAAGEMLSVHRSVALATSPVMGFLQWVRFPRSGVKCANVYITEDGVTDDGDSGAPVTIDDDGIGHVIGASGRVTSYVQHLGYQLNALGAALA